MKDKVVIFGNTEYSFMIAEYIRQFCNVCVSAFVINKDYISESQFHGIDVVAFEDIENKFKSDEVDFILGLGYKSMNTIREKIYISIKEKDYNVASFVHPSAVVETNDLGEGNIILSGAYIGPNSRIGNANIIWNGCNISHNVTIGDYNYFSPSATLGGFAQVGNNCFFGLGSVIRSSVSVADKTLIGAGTYLNNSTEVFDVYVPQRALKLNHKSTDMNL